MQDNRFHTTMCVIITAITMCSSYCSIDDSSIITFAKEAGRTFFYLRMLLSRPFVFDFIIFALFFSAGTHNHVVYISFPIAKVAATCTNDLPSVFCLAISTSRSAMFLQESFHVVILGKMPT